jgi:hypothetical protein
VRRDRKLIASLHIVEYRKRVFSPPKRLVGKVVGLRFWRPLNIGADFAWFREHPSRWSLYTQLKPDLRLCGAEPSFAEQRAFGRKLPAASAP